MFPVKAFLKKNFFNTYSLSLVQQEGAGIHKCYGFNPILEKILYLLRLSAWNQILHPPHVEMKRDPE